MINQLLMNMLWLSITGSLLILIMYSIKPLISHKLSKSWQYYIWLMVIFRLILPYSLEVNFLGNAFQEIRSTISVSIPQVEAPNESLPVMIDSQPIADDVLHSAEIPYDESDNSLISETQAATMQQLQGTVTVILSNLWLIWLIIALVILIRKITIYQSFIHYVEAGRTEVSDMECLESFGKIMEQEKIKHTVRIYTNNLISSPLLVGFFKPCIILPTTELSVIDFRNIVLHELTHYKRFDMFYKWLVQLTICLHWFNPLVYLMGREINRMCELSCDEAVVAKLGLQEQKSYGDTLLNTLVTGHYKQPVAYLPLNESRQFIKERLDFIMNFKKQTKFTSTVSIVLTAVLCFGAGATGIYAAPSTPKTAPLAVDQPKPAVSVTKPPEPTASAAKVPEISMLTLVEKEYTLDELKSLDISGVVVEVLSENVSVTRSGETLKFQYYTLNTDDYTLQKESDGGGTRQNLCLLRETPLKANEIARSIIITIPDKANLKVIQAITSTGNITIEDCTASFVLGAETKSGAVFINGDFASRFFKVVTDTGNALVTGTALGEDAYAINIETQSGTISFQPKDSVQNYSFDVASGENAEVTVNGKKYTGENYTINGSAPKQVYFDSPKGTLIVQDLSAGKLSLVAPSSQLSQPSPTIQPKPTSINNVTQTKKEYTASDLQSMNITGIRVNALADNVVLSQGGTSLILQYDQAYADEYTVQTKQYQLYMDGYGPESQADLPGTIEQLVFSRTSVAAPEDAPRTIYITLPADLKLNRVVKVITDSGSITAEKCSSTAMLDLITQTGHIKAGLCNSAFLGAETHSGNIELTNCKTADLGIMTISGKTTLQLAERAVNYKMTIDTGTEAKITVNGKTYEGGEFVLNKNSLNIIQFDSRTGSLIVKDIASE